MKVCCWFGVIDLGKLLMFSSRVSLEIGWNWRATIILPFLSQMHEDIITIFDFCWGIFILILFLKIRL